MNDKKNEICNFYEKFIRKKKKNKKKKKKKDIQNEYRNVKTNTPLGY